MPIAASLPVIQPLIVSGFSLGTGADPKIVATIIASSVASIVPMGLLPAVPSPIPLTPSGLSAGKSMIENAFSLGNGANINTVASMIANGISLIAPLAPPTGLSFLESQIVMALSLGNGSNSTTVATMIASAIPQYYTMGGII